MASSFTLGKEERLKSRKLIERVFREGKSFALFPFRVYYIPLPVDVVPGDSGAPMAGTSTPRSFQCLQAGFGASSRNFKRAVDRNRIKRLSREAYRLQKQPLYEWLKEKDQALAVFFIYTGKELPTYEIVREKIGLALQKLMKTTGI
jgi:ribonuclease P protein component